MLAYTLVLPGSFHSRRVSPCQILVVLPQHFDCDYDKYSNVGDEDNGHWHDKRPQKWTSGKIIVLGNGQPAAVGKKYLSKLKKGQIPTPFALTTIDFHGTEVLAKTIPWHLICFRFKIYYPRDSDESRT